MLSIKQVLDIPGTSQSFSSTIDLSGILRHGQVLFPNVLAVEGEVSNRAGVVTLRYQVSGELPYECDRCLMPCKLDLTQEFTHTVVRSLADNQLDDIFIVLPDSNLDICEIASSDLLLSLPTTLLCKEDCKGLCSECGANLNEKQCGCQTDKCDSRLNILKSLLDN